MDMIYVYKLQVKKRLNVVRNMAESKVSYDMEEECLDAFFCPITREIMINPVTLISDGHSYEQSAIAQWFATGQVYSYYQQQNAIIENMLFLK